MNGIFGYVGMFLGLLGALLTAIPNHRVASWGFFAFLLADLPLVTHAVLRSDPPLIALYSGFIVLALLGVFLRTRKGLKLFEAAAIWLTKFAMLQRYKARGAGKGAQHGSA